MHVLIIPSWYPDTKKSISGSFFREQAVSLCEAGLQVGVLSVQVYSIKKIFKISKKFGFKKEIDCGVTTYRFYFPNIFPKFYKAKILLIKLIGYLLYKYYACHQMKPDIIHVHSVFYAGYIALKIKEKAKVPYIISEHNSGFHSDAYSKKQITSAFKPYKESEKLLAVSTCLAQSMNRLYCEKLEWDVLHNSVSSIFEPKNTSNNKMDEFIFFNVSSMTKNKNVRIIIIAFSKIQKMHKNARLVIGGIGSQHENLKKLAKELNIDRKVSFTGKLSRSEVAVHMAASDCYVLSSNYETFGVVAIEALASGTPVITTKCGGPEDIVVNEKLGIVIEPNSEEQMSYALNYAIKKRKEFSKKLITTFCKNNFSQKIISKKTKDIYENIIRTL